MEQVDREFRPRAIVFCPYQVESPRFGKVYEGHMRQRNSCDSETCKKTAKPGDLYLFYFGSPEFKIESVAVCRQPPDPKGSVYPEGGKRIKMWFCPMDRLYHFKKPITVGDLEASAVTAKWWATKPYYGRPKEIPEMVAGQLLRTIAKREPEVAPLLNDYIGDFISNDLYIAKKLR